MPRFFIVKNILFQPALLAVFLVSGFGVYSIQAASAATYYASPSGSGSSCTQGTPCSLATGISTLAAGDTLTLADGTYNTAISGIPSGTAGAYTTIKAQNDGGAVITQAFMMAHTDAYISFEGLKFSGAFTKNILGNHIKVLRCAFEGGGAVDNVSNVAIGTNDYNDTAYILIEDSWAYGLGGRYNILVYNSNNVVLRRNVVRHDGGWTDTKGDPEAAICIYNSSYIELQNNIVVDSSLNTYHTWDQAFYFVYNSASPNATTHLAARGNIVLNNINNAYRTDGNGIVSFDAFTDNVAYGLTPNGDGFAFVNGGSSATITWPVTKSTAGSAAYGVGHWGGGSPTISDSALFNLTTADTAGGWSMSYLDRYNVGSSGTCSNCSSYNPQTNGLLYLPRIESGSTLATGGQGGGRIGADVTKKIGTSGTLYGDTGYATTTTDNLWPWPNEARIKSDMAAVSARGFATGTSMDGSSQTLTKYIWEYLGNQIPADIYAPDTTAPTITSVTSTTPDGTYNEGDTINVTITFSEAVTSTGSVTVTLETGATDRTCAFTVSNSTTGSCTYTVQAGDTSSDLTTNSIAGTIADQASNAMSVFTPVANLAASSAIVIDTTDPSGSITVPTAGVVLSGTATLTASASDNVAIASVQFKVDGANQGTADTSSPYSISWDTTGASNGSHSLTATITDTAGNAYTTSGVSVTLNNVAALNGLTSCFLSDNPSVLSNDCTNTLGQDIPIPDLYDGTANTEYDSPFGAKYMRISIPVGATGDPTEMYPVYSKTSAWNADGSRLLVASSAGWYHLFDGTTYQWIRRLEHPANYIADGQDLEPHWSQTDPDIFYYRAGMSIYRYSVASNASTLVRTFTDAELGTTGCTSIRTGEEGNPSDDSRYWGLWCQNGSPSYAQQAYFVYDMVTDTVISSKLVAAGGMCGASACPLTANWVGMSHSGNHFIVQWNGSAGTTRTQVESHRGTEAYDRSLNWVSLVSETYNHADLAQTADGTDVYIGPADQNQTNGYSASRSVRLSDGAVLKSCMFPQYPLYNHVSGRAGSAIKGWVLYSSYNQAGTGMGTQKLNEEVWAQNIDTCEIRRFAHTQSNWSATKYRSEPHAVMSFDFSKVLWGSNWRDQAANVQAYVAEAGSLAPDTTNPSGSLTAPANGATVSGAIDITASASDNVAIASVQFKVDGTNQGTADTSSPYSISWDTTGVSDGAHLLTATITDTSNNTYTTTAVSVTVDNTTPDTTAPTVLSVSSDTANGSYNQGDVIDIDVTFSEAVTSTGSVTVTLETGTTDRTCTFTVSSSTTGTCNYTVQTGDTSSDLTVNSITGTVADAAANPMTSPATPTTNLAANKALVIDTTAPSGSITAPTEGSTVSGTVAISATASDDQSIASVQFRVDGANFGSADISAPYSVSGDTTLLPDGSHTVSALITDVAGNTYVTAVVNATVNNTTPDTTAPTITSVTSTTPDGTYNEGDIINVTITFSEAVTSTGSVTVTLETGTTDQTCTFTVSNSTIGTCNYTVQAGDTSADLTVNSISGTVNDASSNSMTSPATPITNLAASSAIVIDTTSPVAPSGLVVN